MPASACIKQKTEDDPFKQKPDLATYHVPMTSKIADYKQMQKNDWLNVNFNIIIQIKMI